MTPEQRLEKLIEFGTKEYGLVIEPKASKWYWRAAGTLLTIISFGKIDFMNRFFSTFGNRVGTTPSWEAMWAGTKYEILLHELEHMRQKKVLGLGNIWFGMIVMGFAYLFLPFPIGLAWCRAYFEKKGYEQSIRALIQVSGLFYARAAKENIVRNFTGPSYLFMWPFKSSIERWFDEAVERIYQEELAKGDAK